MSGAAPGAELRPGERLGPYVLEEELGRGAATTVLRATARDGGQVVVKILDRDPAPALRRRFERERDVAAELDHPYLVPVVDLGDADGRPYLVTRFVTGGTLEARLEGEPLESPELLDVVWRVGAGLDVLHRAGVLHRDVKPANVLLGEDGAVLTDFGVARGAEHTVLTKVGSVVGTADYLAPEAIRGDEVGPAADVYGLGCLAYACATGAPPFADKRSVLSICRAHLAEPPPDPHALRPELLPALASALLTALAKEPRDRPGTGTAYALLLRAAARGA
jgi:serine/threonine-protein kinase